MQMIAGIEEFPSLPIIEGNGSELQQDKEK
jgi:hypothetical protein